ncbi:MAG: TonB-dependent receptor [Proteobacteria bacterium]|nr:TonB-dependent receptor [Pseudomonadota bacterium]
MKLKKIAQLVALIGIASPAIAQDANAERVTITGSSIKRIQLEGALPIQVISKDDIDRAGIVSAEQLVARISANGTGADNLSSNVGIQLGTTDRNNNGNASANLRGLGASSTLVLLNGRRISLHGAKGNAVDLNSIPLAAVQSVEILKDGASAIYGTDAIGGVINFILRKDFTGAELTGFVDTTQQGGGDIKRGSIVVGKGDLAKDGFNVMATLTFDKQDRLAGSDRSFANGYQPDRGLAPNTAGTPFASQTGLAGTAIGATFKTPAGGAQTYNRANLLSFQGKCDTVPGMSQFAAALWASPGAAYACAYDYGGREMLIQPVERTTFVTRGTMQLNPSHSAFLEIVGSRNKADKEFEQLQITTTGSILGAAYPVGGPYYQNLSAYIPTFDPTKPIAYRWRCTDCGNRQIETTTDAYRVLAGLEGVIGKWDYKLGLSSAGSSANSNLNGGYYYQAGLISALGSGQINPWLLPGQSQTSAGMALLQAASATGAKLFGGKAGLTQLDGSISGELAQLPAGPLGAAVGFDIRKETYQFSDGSLSGPAIYQAPFDAEFKKVSRDIKAVYAELAVPIVKTLEAQIAVRHDDYSLFGGTTNPKVALRWNPIKQAVFRGSYNTGFRAPSFFQLYGAQGDAPVPGNIADPILCPQKPGDLSVCSIRPNARQGGNSTLTPEKSKQWSIGTALAPADWITGTIDLWQIERTDRIYELTPQQVIANYQSFPGYLVRGTDGRLDGPGGYIRAGFVNAAGDIARGVDVSLNLNGRLGAGKWLAGLDGTYMNSFRSRVFTTDPYTETVGLWNSRDLFVRWKHTASFTYTEGVWGGTVSQSYTAGYKDQVPTAAVPAGFNPDVKSYIVYNVSATYTGYKNTTITAGIKNLFNTDPPFTAHDVDFAAGAGWDPRVADPRGRAFTVMAKYVFK